MVGEQEKFIRSTEFYRVSNVVAAVELGFEVTPGLESLAKLVENNSEASFEDCLDVLDSCDKSNSNV